MYSKGTGAKPEHGPHEVMHALRELKNNFRGGVARSSADNDAHRCSTLQLARRCLVRVPDIVGMSIRHVASGITSNFRMTAGIRGSRGAQALI